MAPALIGAALSITGTTAGTAGATDATQAPFDLTDAKRIEAGKLRFGTSCAAYCHGSEGMGGRAPRFKGRTDFDPAFAFKTITLGKRGGTDVMPAWGGAYNPEEIWELVAYLQHLAKLSDGR